VKRAWIVAGMTFAVLVTAAGVRSAQTMLILPLEARFGIQAEPIIASAIALNILLFGLVGPFAAALYEKYGVRRTVGVALVLIGIASAATPAIISPWQLLFLWGIVVGSGIGAISLTLGATIATRWFAKNRGVVMGVFSAGNATGQLIFLPLFAQLIAHRGWEACSFALAAASILVAPFFLTFVRDKPPGEPLQVASGNPFARAISGLREASKSRDFWLLAGTFAICGASTNGLIGTHLIPACGDHGISQTKAAGLLAAMGVFDLIGTTLSGWLSDRFSNRALLFGTMRCAGSRSSFFRPRSDGRPSDFRRSPSSTAWIGSQRFRRRSASRPTRSERREPRSSSGGLWPHTKSARASPRSRPASCGSTPAATTPPSSPRAPCV
jgi:MFS family permease